MTAGQTTGMIAAVQAIPKLGDLNPEERWVYVAGVLAVAECSPHPPLLLVEDGHPARFADIAREAKVRERLVKQSMDVFRAPEHRLLEHDGARPSVWRVPAGIWERVHSTQAASNGRVPSDRPEATRERKRRERDERRRAPRLL